MRSSGFFEVAAPNPPDFAVGDNVKGMTGSTEYALSNRAGVNKVLLGVNAETALAVFALPGLTATQGLFNMGNPKTGYPP